MKLLRTMTLWAVLLIGALVGWAVYLPSSQPVLDRMGLLEPMRAIGIPVAEPQVAGGPGRGFGPGAGGARIIVQEVGQAQFGDRLGAIGTAEALRSVTLTPEVAGRLEEVLVAPGDYIEAGTVIAQLDSRQQELAIDRARLALQDAQARADRLARLRESGTATEVQIQDVELALGRAELDLRNAEFELARRQITAPFSGWIGLIGVEPGNQVALNTQLARLDDRATLLVDFNIPERFVGQVRAGDRLRIAPLARTDEQLDGYVRAVDARVSQTNRTLRVQGAIDNPDDRLRPGMSFHITVLLPGDSYPVVDPLAIQWDRRGSFVWRVNDADQAERVGIDIVQRRDDAVLLRADLSPGDRVVIEGVQNLRPGAAVSVAETRPAIIAPEDEAAAATDAGLSPAIAAQGDADAATPEL